MKAILRSLVLVVACLVAVEGLLQAEDFCVFNKVYVGKEINESTTIFRSGRVYDLLADPGEITIYDPPHSRFVVIDPQRKLKTEITTDQIESFCQRIRSEVMTTQDPLSRFLATPEFSEVYDEGSGDLSLKNDWLVYEAKTAPPKFDTMAKQYGQYLTWQTKLNTVLRPGALLPYARVKLNDALLQRGRMPVEVQATRYMPGAVRKSFTLRSEHRVQPVVLASDLARLDDANRYLATFAVVPMLEYQRRGPGTETKTPASTQAAK